MTEKKIISELYEEVMLAIDNSSLALDVDIISTSQARLKPHSPTWGVTPGKQSNNQALSKIAITKITLVLKKLFLWVIPLATLILSEGYKVVIKVSKHVASGVFYTLKKIQLGVFYLFKSTIKTIFRLFFYIIKLLLFSVFFSFFAIIIIFIINYIFPDQYFWDGLINYYREIRNSFF